MNSFFHEAVEENPIIAAVKNMDDLKICCSLEDILYLLHNNKYLYYRQWFSVFIFFIFTHIFSPFYDLNFGSSASLNPSPNILNANTVIMHFFILPVLLNLILHTFFF